MRTRSFLTFIATTLFVLPLAMWSQDGPPMKPGGPEVPPGPGMHRRMMMRHEMGKWWKNSDVAKRLQLNETQITQLDQIFTEHKLKLIDFGAQMQKEDLKLQTLVDADVPNEGQVGAQVDQLLAARGKLEREFTMMNLNLRKVLSVDQWRQLKAIRDEHHPQDHMMFFHGRGSGRVPDPPAMPDTPPPPPQE